MPSLSPKDRISLCLFSFTDGRRCRTPRISSHPHFCFYHAQKESQSQAAEQLSQDLAYFFSGDYLSACDLSTALSRLIPAVIRGEIKPRLARTVAYMFQTLLQSTHLAQHEYINAFGTDGWRQAVHSSVNANQDYLFPPDPNAVSNPPQSTSPVPPPAARPSPAAAEAALNFARSLFPPHPNATHATPAQSVPVQPVSAQPAPTAPAATTCHPERSEGPQQVPAPPTTDETRPASNPQPTQPPTPNRRSIAPTRDPYAVHYDHNYRLLIDGKPW
jgi:hypothetical protein